MASRKPRTVKYTRKDGTEVVYRYARSKRQEPPRSLAPTLEDLIVEYKASHAFKRLTETTRKDYARTLEFLRENVGAVEIAAVKRRHIMDLRDALSEQPAKANRLVSAFAYLFDFAIDREYRADNPALRITRFALDGYKPWPEKAVAYALDHLPERWRRAVVLAVYTGQRPGDVVRMRWDDYEDGGIWVVQQKTGTKIWVAAARALRDELDEWGREKTALTILTNSHGKPWRPMAFAQGISQELRKHPKLDGLVMHGLRKTAATRLADAGCSPHEIASITGHASLAMVAYYSKAANQKGLAKAAVVKLENHRKAK